MSAVSLLAGDKDDAVLAQVQRALAHRGREAVLLSNLANVEVTTPVGGAPGAPAFGTEGKYWQVSARSAALIVNMSFYFAEGEADPVTRYRWSENHAAWLTFFALFPGLAVNRPSSHSPPIHNDGLLVRSLARSLGMPVVPERIASAGTVETPGQVFAAIDLASGAGLWVRSGERTAALVSRLEYAPDAEHCVVVVLPGDAFALSQRAGDAECSVDPAPDAEKVGWARRLLGALGLDYGYVVFVRLDRAWALTRVYTSPPLPVDGSAIEMIAGKLSAILCPDVAR